MVELLKQGRLVPWPVESQVIAIFAAVKGFVDDIAVEHVQAFRDGAIDYVTNSHSDIITALKTEKKISDELDEKLRGALDEFKGIFVAERTEAAPAVTDEQG
jgi:F-type H+-transporting ATPase subunit alpha